MPIPQTNKVVILLALAVAGVFIYWRLSKKPVPPPPPPPAPVVAPRPVVPDAAVVPAIQHPIEKASTGRMPSGRLPGLDESDDSMREPMARLFGKKRLGEMFILEGIIRRIVATIDSLPRDQVAFSMWPIKPVPGEFKTEGAGATLMDSPKNRSRYDSRLDLAEAVEPRKLVALYVRHYPLFQQAYRELGYPTGYFNDRLIEVIDHLLATPLPPHPVRLSRPKVRYEFADPELQARSAGQKILMRMGPEQASRIKGVLAEIRREVTGQLR